MSIVVAHEFFRTQEISSGIIAKLPGQIRLHIERKMLGLSPRPVMDGMTNAPQKIVCAKNLPRFVLRDQIVRAHLSQVLVSVLRVRQPNCSVKVAESARRLLDIGLLETN